MGSENRVLYDLYAVYTTVKGRIDYTEYVFFVFWFCYQHYRVTISDGHTSSIPTARKGWLTTHGTKI